jgi:hypothetical protein
MGEHECPRSERRCHQRPAHGGDGPAVELRVDLSESQSLTSRSYTTCRVPFQSPDDVAYTYGKPVCLSACSASHHGPPSPIGGEACRSKVSGEGMEPLGIGRPYLVCLLGSKAAASPSLNDTRTPPVSSRRS